MTTAGTSRARGPIRAGLAVLLLALVVTLSGCGHSARSHSFAKDYLSVSHDYSAQLAKIQASARSAQEQGPSAEINVFRDILTTTTTTLSRLKKLNAPGSSRTSFDELIDALDTQVTSLQRVLDGVSRNDSATVNQALSDYADSLQKGLALQHRLDDALQPRAP